jgi:hypothetical protein
LLSGGDFGDVQSRILTYVRSEVSTAVTMKITIFVDMKTQFVPHRRKIKSPLQNTAG